MSRSVVSEQDFSLASQCLAFFKTLVSHGRPVSFSLKIGSCLEYSLDTSDEVKVPAYKVRKTEPANHEKKQNKDE